jgi:hypothetical protein
MNSLVLAERLVGALGSHDMFREQYTLARQYHSVRESVELALEQQGLLDLFLERIDNDKL